VVQLAIIFVQSMHTLVIPSVYVLSPNLDLHELQSEFAQVKQFVIFAH
jgi:hypothetical protein